MDVLVVYKKSALQLYQESQDEKLQVFLTKQSSDLDNMKASHQRQQENFKHLKDVLQALDWNYEHTYRDELHDGTMITDKDLLISAGGDGTFIDVSHVVSDIPLLGYNSDPQASLAFFSWTHPDNVYDVLADLEHQPKTTVQRLELILNDQPLNIPVLNDILIAHPNPAATTRYRIIATNDGNVEEPRDYKHSGLLVCAAAGSTGWMYEANGDIMQFDAKKMQYITFGKRGERSHYANRLDIHSKTTEAKIYVDGAHSTYDFPIGSDLVVTAGKPLTIIGDLEQKRREFEEKRKLFEDKQ